MSKRAGFLCAVAVMFAASAARSAGWELQAPAPGRGVVLTHDAGETSDYRFECAGPSIIITNRGVTKLMDLTTGQPVAEDAAPPLPAGAALMALFAGKGQPDFQPAEATRNPDGGWDLTIRLVLQDKAVKAIAKAKLLSLFTSGFTAAVEMDGPARAKWVDFMQQCQARG